MAELGNLSVRLGAELGDFLASFKRASDAVSQFSNKVNSDLAGGFAKMDATVAKFEKGIGRLGSAIQSAGKGFTVGLTVPMAAFGGIALSTAGEMDALRKSLANALPEGASLAEELAKLKEVAKNPGLGFEEAIKGSVRLQSVGISAELARRSLGAFGNAIAQAGGGKAELDGVSVALTQIASKGKVSAEEINQIAERVPQIRKAMQDAFGTADTEVLQKMGVDTTAFITKIVTELEKIPKATGGMKNAFENFGDTTNTVFDRIGTALNKAFNIEGLVNRVGDFMDRLSAAFESLDPASQRLIFIFAGVVAAIGPLLLALGGIMSIAGPITAGLSAIGGVLAGVSAPMLAIAAGIAAAAYLIITHWEDIVNYFSNGPGDGIWQSLKAVVVQVMDTITAVVQAGVALVIAVWDKIGPVLSGSLQTAFEIIGPIFRNGLGLLYDILGVFKSIFTGDWAGLWDGLINIFKRIWNQLVNVFVGALSGFTRLASNILGKLGLDNAFTQGLKNINAGFENLASQIKFNITEPTVAVTSLKEELKKVGTEGANAGVAAGKGLAAIGDAAARAFARIKSLTEGIVKLNQDKYGNQTVKGFDALDAGGPANVTIDTEAAVKSMQDLQNRLKPIIGQMSENWRAEWEKMGQVSVDMSGVIGGAISEFAGLVSQTLADMFTGPDKSVIESTKLRINAIQEEIANVQKSGEISAATALKVKELNDKLAEQRDILSDAEHGGAKRFFSGLIEIVASFLSAFGKALVSAGVAAIAFQKLLLNPYAAVVAGVAVTAAAAIVKNLLKQGFGGVGSFASGINNVPHDMIALIHKGEAVVPKKFNTGDHFGGGGPVIMDVRLEGNDLLLQQRKTLQTERRYR